MSVIMNIALEEDQIKELKTLLAHEIAELDKNMTKDWGPYLTPLIEAKKSKLETILHILRGCNERSRKEIS